MRRLGGFLAIFLALSTSACTKKVSDPPELKVGVFVVVRADDAPLKTFHADKVLGSVKKGTVFEVLEVMGNLFRVSYYVPGYETVEGWLHRGDVMALIEGLAFAEAELKRAASAKNYAARALIRNIRKESDLAIDDANQAIRCDPDFAQAYFVRGLARISKGETKEAIEDFGQAIRLAPNDARVYDQRGVVYWQLGKYELAITDLDEGVRLDPNNAVMYQNRGTIWLGKGDDDRAIADAGEAIRLKPHYGSAFGVRAVAWYAKGEYEKAIQDFNETIRLGNADPKDFVFRGNAFARIGDFKKALDDYRTAADRDPTDTVTLDNWAWLLATCPDARFRDGKQAVELANRAGKHGGWKEGSRMRILAAAYAEAGDFGNAIKSQEKTIELVAEDPRLNDLEKRRLALYKSGIPFHQDPKQKKQ